MAASLLEALFRAKDQSFTLGNGGSRYVMYGGKAGKLPSGDKLIAMALMYREGHDTTPAEDAKRALAYRAEQLEKQRQKMRGCALAAEPLECDNCHEPIGFVNDFALNGSTFFCAACKVELSK